MTETTETPEWEEFITVPEAAEILRVSKMTIYRLIHRGDVDAIRVGRSFRLRKASVHHVATEGTDPSISRVPA